MKSIIFVLTLLIGSVQLVAAQAFPLGIKNDKLAYLKDIKGNRILDFSSCGYRSSEKEIPDVPIQVFVSWREEDCSAVIQHAIDYVSSLKPDKDGFRGTVLLDEGVFSLNDGLSISTSGVVLRGADRDKTILLKKGVDRGALMRVEGKNDYLAQDTVSIVSAYVPVNNLTFEVTSAVKLKVGDRITIVRPSTKEWITSIGCHVFGGGISALGWKEGDTDLFWDRNITNILGNQITVDVPLTVAIDQTYGGGKVLTYKWNGRISDCGVENLTLVSDYDTNYSKDENHSWTGVSIENAENCWVRRVNFKHFAGSAVFAQQTSSKVTVEDCISKEPVSEIGGMRRCTFFTMGQQTLIQRCYSEHGIHDFAVGACAPGPNAFVQCDSKESLGFSGAIDSWACGLLFDVVNIDGHNLSYKNMGQNKNGAGWGTANSLFWQCTAAEIECYTPAEDAQNRAYGCWAQFSGDGQWKESNNHVQPRSFFYTQLEERLNKDFSIRARILPLNTSATSSPTVEQATELTKIAFIPRLTLETWINQGTFPASVTAVNVKGIDDIKYKTTKTSEIKNHIGVTEGRLVMNGELLVGGMHDVPWWNGSIGNKFLPKAKPHITRFVPGREGLGLTDRVDSVISYMKNNHVLVLHHNYGLWYDRRRDDHERIRRRDGDVWAPFYEQPFARSSQGTAWEGLSKYDLSKPNTWYWHRLKIFADKAQQEGLLLFHENYFQHNIIEAGAHWADSPWRSANNINDTGFPEPVPYAGDKRIFMAEMFYDINHPARRELHRNYIRQCLNSFAGNDNVVQLISEEYTGPLHFVQFWLDVIAEWEAETGKHALVALSTTKDVQDAILNDDTRSKLIDIIDIKYWHYKTDGIFAPEGGKNMAPRQHMRKMKVGKVTFSEAYKAVNEYRQKYPDKAVTFSAQNYPAMAWASFMAGGSCPTLPVTDKKFLKDASTMKVEETDTDNYKKMVNSGKSIIIYSQFKGNVPVLLEKGRYVLKQINPKTGDVHILSKSVKGGQTYQLDVDSTVYWFDKL